MPVIRQPIQVRDTRQIRPVNSPRSQMGDLLGQQANVMAEKAHQAGILLGEEAREKTRMWARNAVITDTDGDGVPNLPEDITIGMGEIARDTWDAVIGERYVHQLQATVRGQINAAKVENLEDGSIEGFTSRMAPRREKMLESLPKEFVGAFEQIYESEMINAGSDIGHDAKILDMREKRDQLPLQVQTYIGNFQSILLDPSKDERDMAVNLMAGINFIEGTPAAIATRSYKDAQIKNLTYAYSQSLNDKLENINSMSASDLEKLQMSILYPSEGSNAALARRFPVYDGAGQVVLDPNGDPIFNPDHAARYASHLQDLISYRNGQNAERVAQMKEVENIQTATSGAGSNTKTFRDALSTGISQALKIEPSGFTPEFILSAWSDPNSENRDVIRTMVKNAGILPTPLKKLFNQAGNTQDPELLRSLLPVWRDIRDAPNSSGQVIDMTDPETIRPDANKALSVIDALVGGGGEENMSLEDAVLRWNDIRENPLSDVDYARLLVELDGNEDGWIFGNDFESEGLEKDPKLLKSYVKAYLADVILGEGARSDEMESAYYIFKSYVVSQGVEGTDAIENATELTIASMKGRYTESDYFQNDWRSQGAPEKWMPNKNILDSVINSEIRNRFGAFTDSDERRSWDVPKGMVNGMTIGGHAANLEGVIFEPRDDYYLKPVGASGKLGSKAPRYDIWMKQGGIWQVFAPDVDLHGAYDAHEVEITQDRTNAALEKAQEDLDYLKSQQNIDALKSRGSSAGESRKDELQSAQTAKMIKELEQQIEMFEYMLDSGE